MKRSEVGRKGEDLACEYIRKKHYRVIERNYRRPWGEIDVVARAPDGTLVFVEVKTLAHRSDSIGLEPEDNVSAAKMRKLKRTCEKYTLNYPERVDEERGWRIDVMTLTMNEKDCVVRWYENV